MTGAHIDGREMEEALNEFVVVRLEDEYFAFDVTDVAEVLPYSEPVRMPRAPKFLVGLVDVRGLLLARFRFELCAEVGDGVRG